MTALLLLVLCWYEFVRNVWLCKHLLCSPSLIRWYLITFQMFKIWFFHFCVYFYYIKFGAFNALCRRCHKPNIASQKYQRSKRHKWVPHVTSAALWRINKKSFLGKFFQSFYFGWIILAEFWRIAAAIYPRNGTDDETFFRTL